MKRYKKFWFYLLLVLSISLTILIINDINDSLIPKIIQDINSGVIGAILTTIITLILLSNQTESQENLTKSSVVYEERLKIFNSFLDTIGACLEDGKLTAQDTYKIIHSFSILRIHLTSENARKLETAICAIDNSFFYHDENSLPNLNKLISLYTNITNVFRQELYGDNSTENLKSFNFDNLKHVLYRKRISINKPNTFDELISELKINSRILHTSTTSGINIVFDIDDELINSLAKLHDFIKEIVREISSEIIFSYEIYKVVLNNESYSGIPWIKIHYKNKYFAFFGINEAKRLWIGRNIPEKKQIASFEIFETAKLPKYRQQVINDFSDIIKSINDI